MIEIYDMNGFVREPNPETITFGEIKDIISFKDVKGNVFSMVEFHEILEGGKIVQTLCNEDGQLGASIGVPMLLRNGLAKRRVGDKLNGPCWGNWVFLSSKDKLL